VNRNTFYAEIFVDELARSGLKHVVLAPGSRNTALVLAFAKNDAIRKHSHMDERSAAFYALGLALATDEPVAIVCTSGTAAANFFPAVIEAHQSCVPLLVLTADRPPELRHSGANQTIDQVKLYGDYALWFVDAALPEADPPPVAVRHLRTLANRALAKANGIRKGVVHINLAFRKPLEPTQVVGDNWQAAPNLPPERPHTMISHGDLHPNDAQIAHLMQWIGESPRGIIIAGPNATKSDSDPFRRLSQVTGYPILAEPTSGLRFHDKLSESVIAGYNLFPLDGEFSAPDIIVQFGDLPTSNALLTYLGGVRPKHRVLITENGEWRDDLHTLTALIQADPALVCDAITDRLTENGVYSPEPAWRDRFKCLEQITWETVEGEISSGAYFDGGAVYDVIDLIPAGSSLFAGNSLPIRHLDQFGKPVPRRIHAYANRGTSGIDGNISTALGIGAARPDRPLVAIVGDITFYHDMNGLLAVHRCGVPVTIVLLNNNGGGIFHRLPVRDYDPAFTDYFLTPHGLDFSHAARLYGLEYIRADSRAEFREVFSAGVGTGKSTVIEVRTDAKTDLARRNSIMQKVQERLTGKG
jgi:2-succinyl-5-enolpyruvyl-6-hydroxy-3-cyclohexene-1-carboxylate synthase